VKAVDAGRAEAAVYLVIHERGSGFSLEMGRSLSESRSRSRYTPGINLHRESPDC
jgi:hypothetical protein